MDVIVELEITHVRANIFFVAIIARWTNSKLE